MENLSLDDKIEVVPKRFFIIQINAEKTWKSVGKEIFLFAETTGFTLKLFGQTTIAPPPSS